MSQNQNKRTLRTIGLVVAVTLLTKILGIVREALQAGVFGTQTAFDLYTISYNYTIYIFTTVAYALCIAAVPVISRHLAEDRNKAFAVAGNLICVSVLVSALVVVLASVLIRFAPVGHWLGVSDADLPTLRTYLQICLLTLPLIVVIYLLVAVFQSMEHYTLQGQSELAVQSAADRVSRAVFQQRACARICAGHLLCVAAAVCHDDPVYRARKIPAHPGSALP